MLGIILDIILIILKITGILLLAILGLVVLLTLIILFVPIRYNSVGDFEKDEGFTHHIYAKATWCLHIVSVTFSRIENENDLVIKVFGINVDKFKKRKKASKKQKTKKEKTAKLTSETTKKSTDKPSVESLDDKVLKTTSENTNKKPLSDTNKTYKPIDNQVETKEKKPSIFDKIKLKVKAILDKVLNICDKIKKYDDVKNSFIEYLRKDESKTAIKEIKKITIKLMKHIMPRKLKSKIGFGFEDASATGKALGALSIFYAIYGDNLELEPDFDKQVLYGKYKLKGRIYIYFLLIVAWKLYKDEWIRDFVAFSKKTVKDL